MYQAWLFLRTVGKIALGQRGMRSITVGDVSIIIIFSAEGKSNGRLQSLEAEREC